MPGKSFARGEEARRALLSIASDPEYGTGTLSDPQTLANLLHDLLPDSPREAGVLAAAAAQDLVGRLQDQMSQGLELTSAIRLAAASFESNTAFTPEACTWAAGEMAVAAGLADASHIPGAGLRPRTRLPGGRLLSRRCRRQSLRRRHLAGTSQMPRSLRNVSPTRAGEDGHPVVQADTDC